MNSRLRVGVVGTGSFGIVLAQYLSEFAQIVSICDPNLEKLDSFSRQTGLRVSTFEHHEDLLEKSDVDAIVITSPNHIHKEITLAAANQGKHVFCEKAMATSVPDCWDMVRACENAGVRLMVGHKRRLRPAWAKMIELRKVLGRVLAISSCGYFDARPYRFAESWWGSQEKSGGTLMVSGVHIIDWMRAMCGDVSAVWAIAAPQVDSRFDFPDTLHVSLKFHSGAVSSLTVSLAFPPLKFRESGESQVVYQHGGARLVSHLKHLDLSWEHSGEETPPQHEIFDDLGFNHAYRKELQDFIRWIVDGTEPCLSWREGLRCVEIMEAAHHSAEAGGITVKLPLYPNLEQ